MLSRLNPQEDYSIGIQRDRIPSIAIVNAAALIRGSVSMNRQYRDRDEASECQDEQHRSPDIVVFRLINFECLVELDLFAIARIWLLAILRWLLGVLLGWIGALLLILRLLVWLLRRLSLLLEMRRLSVRLLCVLSLLRSNILLSLLIILVRGASMLRLIVSHASYPYPNPLLCISAAINTLENAK